ncbi:ureidoglycolate hydrolase [Phialemonium atrogriseum]|uniref:Ureidoglycolate hydrolase n=1 Tax=Phialemonium atrogriseum TaxID=1093897 RepID=A0AAJ0BQI4_9PEZI|nr:ureidoglycolate hydrolase [Phialemonium atrogriseum]KAK1762355.1 ureidoglycolate hydrolase [Phialemonium atrogriseum]
MATPLTLHITGQDIHLTATPLEQSSFAPFGDVIENPRPDLHPSSAFTSPSPLPFNAIPANQGTAIKYQHVTHLTNLYPSAPSGHPGVPSSSLFSCAAAATPAPSRGSSSSLVLLPIRILERHPFTSQTFIPLGAGHRHSRHRYLVVVAPSLPPGGPDDGVLLLPVPGRGRGLPDVRGLRAFVGSAGQAVTYGAGTWHAPMVALAGGPGREGDGGGVVDFVVVQFANGVGVEDCQEVVLAGSDSGGEGAAKVWVRIPERGDVAARL